jgi:hypothetical protein
MTWWVSSSVHAQPPKPIRQGSKIQELCVVSAWERPRCVTLAELKHLLNPAEAARLLALIEGLMADLGLDPDRNALLSCGKSGVPSTNVAAGPPSDQRQRGLRAGELKQVEQALGACRDAALAARGTPGRATPGGASDYGAWVDSTVSRVDEDLGECRTSANSGIAQGAGTPGSSPEDKVTERRRRFEVVGVLQESVPKGPPADAGTTSLPSGADIFLDTKKKGSGGGGTPPSAAPPPTTPPPTTPPTPTPGSQEWVDKGCGETPGCGPPPTPCEGEGCAPTCEQRQQAWEMFKDFCEQSDWKAYPCVDFLRKVNGCVDMTLINPGPDGDLTCPTWGRDDAQSKFKWAWAEQCRRRKWIMVAITDDTAVCGAPDIFAGPPDLRVDPCNDPRVMPAPDAPCLGGPVTPDKPAPKPPGPPQQPIQPPRPDP